MAKKTYYERVAIRNSIFLPVGFSTLSKKEKQRHLNGRCCGCGGSVETHLEFDGDYDGRVIGMSFDLLCPGCQDHCNIELTENGWQDIQSDDDNQREYNEDFPF